MGSREIRIGLIADTHGLLRPEALLFLQGCDHIVHGGDVGGAEVLDALSSIAPLMAVRGNNDAQLAHRLPPTATLQVDQLRIGAIHDVSMVESSAQRAWPEPATAREFKRAHVVIYGHSHKPRIDERDGVLFINPGSAGPRRFTLPIAIGEMTLDRSWLTVRIVDLGAADHELLRVRRPRPTCS